LVPIHVSLPAMVHGLPPYGNETLQAPLEGLSSCDSTAFIIHEERMLAGRQDSQNRLQCTELVVRT
jgi:hypothetical protein